MGKRLHKAPIRKPQASVAALDLTARQSNKAANLKQAAPKAANIYKRKKRKPIVMTSFLFNVVLGGFEPPQTEPKPVVLPLHHRTMWMQSYNFLQKQPNETAFFLDLHNDYAVSRGQKEPFISHLSIFQNINFH